MQNIQTSNKILRFALDLKKALLLSTLGTSAEIFVESNFFVLYKLRFIFPFSHKLFEKLLLPTTEKVK